MLDLAEHIHISGHSGVRNSVLGARNLMTIAALSLVGSLLVIPLSIFAPVFATTPRALIILCALMGAWYIAYLLPGLFIPRPRTFLATGLPMGIIATFTAPLGPSAAIGNLIGAAFLEIPVLLFFYKKRSRRAHVIGVTIFDGFNSTIYGSAYHIAQDSLQFSLGVVFPLASCYLALALTFLPKRRLAQAGAGVKRRVRSPISSRQASNTATASKGSHAPR